MRLGRAASVAIACIAALAAEGRARADGPRDEKASADSLFQTGKKLMQDGKYAAACPMFAESNRLDEGIGTILWLADCYERNGQSASAWAEFEGVAETAARKKDPREKLARARAQVLEQALLRVVIRVAPDAAVEGLEIRRDGLVVRKSLWNTAVPIDPGPHVITASAPAKGLWEARIVVSGEPSTLQEVQVPPLPDAEAGARIALASPPLSASPTAQQARNEQIARGTMQRAMGLGVIGLGVVGVGIGTYFGLSAKSKLDDSNANNHCHDGNHCDAFGVGARADARGAAALSTTALIVGGAAVAGGIALYLSTAVGSVRVVPNVGRASADLTIQGAF